MHYLLVNKDFINFSQKYSLIYFGRKKIDEALRNSFKCMKTNCIYKKRLQMEPFYNYACPAGPKLSGMGGCSVSFISP